MYDLIIKPILTEKTSKQQDKLNRYCFQVQNKANKCAIKVAVSKTFGVDVVNVKTLIKLSKAKKTKTGYTVPKFIKYAFVTIKAGQTISFEQFQN